MRKISLLLALVLLVSGCAGAASSSQAPASSQATASAASPASSAAPSASPAPASAPASSAATSPYLQLAIPEDAPSLILHTSAGDITLAFFPERAPKTVENFFTHAKNGYYNGLIFHRVIKDFMIQGGDPTGTGRGGESIWGTPFADEFSSTLFCLRGALAMANAGANTNGSQFFIVQAPTLPSSYAKAIEKAGYPKEIVEAYRASGGTPWLDGKHTVFGQVTAGMETVDAIAAVAVNGTTPVTPVKIDSIELVRDWVKQ